ncbi:MAG: MarR family winged helix-turn-helix transcriptional regulator, partial [Gemmatimonadales bacterium]
LNAIALMGDRNEGGAAMGELAETLAMDGTTLSRNLRPLENDGLVRLTHSSTDRRMRLVRLTPRGERMVEAALPLWERAHERVIAALGPEAAAALRDQFDATVNAAMETPSPQKT